MDILSENRRRLRYSNRYGYLLYDKIYTVVRNLRAQGVYEYFVGLLFAVLDVVFLSKPLYTSGSIKKLLLSGKEGMAGRTDFNMGQING